jgi:hypothetical protein
MKVDKAAAGIEQKEFARRPERSGDVWWPWQWREACVIRNRCFMEPLERLVEVAS